MYTTKSAEVALSTESTPYHCYIYIYFRLWKGIITVANIMILLTQQCIFLVWSELQ